MDYRGAILELWRETITSHRRSYSFDGSWAYWLPWERFVFYRDAPARWNRGEHGVWEEFLALVRPHEECEQFLYRLLEEAYVMPKADNTFVFRTDLSEAVRPDGMDALLPLFETLSVQRIFHDEFLQFTPSEPAPVDAPPSRMPPAAGEIMYIEQKPGLTGVACIGRVSFSQTRKTLYYDGSAFQSLKGSGCKANYFEVDGRMPYWISRCRKDGQDTLYPAVVEIDEDCREEYWLGIRQQPKLLHLTRFRSEGKYSKRRPR